MPSRDDQIMPSALTCCDPVAAIAELIPLLRTHAQIERVERAIRRRTGELAAAGNGKAD
jgi:hypothetical protein